MEKQDKISGKNMSKGNERQKKKKTDNDREVNPGKQYKETEMVLGIERKNELNREGIIQRN